MRTPFFITSTYFQNIQNIIQGLFTWRRGTSGGRGKLWRFMYCKPDQIKMRDYMDRLVSPRKRRLPHLLGVPHLPVNTRPLFLYRRRNFGYLLLIQSTMLFLSFLIFFLLFFFYHFFPFVCFVAVVVCLFVINHRHIVQKQFYLSLSAC